jgi:hypothetical protein
MNYNTLIEYYKLCFALMQHHKYSITELENMIVYERDLYVGLLITHMQEREKVNRNVGF